MKHLLLTRFNVDAFSKRGLSLPSDSWLEHRLSLFEQFCFPSVESQTEQDFTWLIFLHPSTEARVVKRLRRLQERRAFEICFTVSCDAQYLSALASRYTGADGLLTTRLDNDDALHSDFVRMVQSAMRESQPSWLNFDHGLQLDFKGIHRSHHKSNAFLSRLECTPQIFTALLERHSDVIFSEEVEHIVNIRAWLQTVHGRNVANRVKKHAPAVSRETALRFLDGYCSAILDYVELIYSQIDLSVRK
jgi:N-acetylglucosaminyl-diphospho-decaprenol L-rhamnosyltransferase